MIKIVELQSENVKRLRAVTITPQGNTVVIAGDNEQGKSSALDSIQYAFDGKRSIPSDPVRHGEESATINIKLSNGLTVTRTITPEGKSQLVVKNADGHRMSSPQSILDAMTGSIAFDPLEFSRMKSKDQARTVRELLGLDFTELDQRRDGLYNQRTDVNREAKRLEGVVLTYSHDPDTPDEEVLIADLSVELERRRTVNRDNQSRRDGLATQIQTQEAKLERLAGIQQQIEELRKAEQELNGSIDANQKVLDADAIGIEKLKDLDTQFVVGQISSAEDTNAKVRANQAFQQASEQAKAKNQESAKLTEQIESIDQDKQKQLTAADMPVPGLSFDESGVQLDGVPLEQASSAQKLKTSIAMGIAMNPELRVQLIREGSALDGKSMKIVEDMAEQHDMQIWIERVGQDADATVIIEDGQVAAALETVPAE